MSLHVSIQIDIKIFINIYLNKYFNISIDNGNKSNRIRLNNIQN